MSTINTTPVLRESRVPTHRGLAGGPGPILTIKPPVMSVIRESRGLDPLAGGPGDVPPVIRYA